MTTLLEEIETALTAAGYRPANETAINYPRPETRYTGGDYRLIQSIYEGRVYLNAYTIKGHQRDATFLKKALEDAGFKVLTDQGNPDKLSIFRLPKPNFEPPEPARLFNETRRKFADAVRELNSASVLGFDPLLDDPGDENRENLDYARRWLERRRAVIARIEDLATQLDKLVDEEADFDFYNWSRDAYRRLDS